MGPDFSSQVPLVVVMDFDGTVTERDMGDAICDHFAPASWHEIDDAWLRGEVSLPDAQKKMWALARASYDEAVAYSLEVGVLRAGLDGLLEEIGARGGRAWLASGGFDFYIEALLEGRLGRYERALYNRARFSERRISVEFPHRDLTCGRCAVCKGRVCDAARALARQVVFIGDGASDRCAIGHADRLFAVRGSTFESAVLAAGREVTPFETFDEVARLLG